MRTKRFSLFIHSRYCPSGGMKDLIVSSDSLEDILRHINKYLIGDKRTEYIYPEGHIYSYDSKSIIVEFDSEYDKDNQTKFKIDRLEITPSYEEVVKVFLL